MAEVLAKNHSQLILLGEIVLPSISCPSNPPIPSPPAGCKWSGAQFSGDKLFSNFSSKGTSQELEFKEVIWERIQFVLPDISVCTTDSAAERTLEPLRKAACSDATV